MMGSKTRDAETVRTPGEALADAQRDDLLLERTRILLFVGLPLLAVLTALEIVRGTPLSVAAVLVLGGIALYVHLRGYRAFLTRAHRLDAKERRLAALGSVAGTVAHDLRSPLTGILGHGELALLMLDGETEEDLAAARASVAHVIGEAHRQQRMLDEIVDMVRGGNPDLRRTGTDPASWLDEEIAPILQRLGTRTVEVSYAPQLSPGLRIDIDTGRLQRALENLLINARDAVLQMPRGQGARRIRLEALACETWLEIRVEDSGAGLPPEIRNRLFEPLVSFGKTGGTGLGLASAHAVAVAHGGTLEAGTSLIEGGARFVLRLPGVRPSRASPRHPAVEDASPEVLAAAS